MAIDHERKLIFYHIAKTGGTSIENYFGWDLETPGVGAWITCGDPKTFHVQQSMTLEELVKYDLFQEEDIPYYNHCCVVRNPWDRLVSAYSDHNRGYDDFNDFVLDFVYPIVEKQNNGEEAIEENYVSQRYRPQSHYLYYKDELIMWSNVGRFEKFNLFFQYMSDMLNEPLKEIPHMKKTKHLHYKEMYNKKAKKQ